MQQRTLGTHGLTVSSIGLGCMGLTPIYGAADEGAAIATVHRAIDLGVTFFDSSDAYACSSSRRVAGPVSTI
jgi:aryl-alcohol dehydrogenase-like predicted oxidoreductase